MGVPLDGQVVRPGVITTQYIENLLVIDNCVFRDNNYGKSSVQVSAPFRILGGSRPFSVNCATHMSSVLCSLAHRLGYQYGSQVQNYQYLLHR
jgi:hypothetical protein